MESLMHASQVIWPMWVAFGCGIFVGVIVGVILVVSVRGD